MDTNQDSYDLVIDEDRHTYKFVSEGPRGKIQKVIAFKPISGIEGYYNLSFGDWNEVMQKINDSVVTNNLDTVKVLATVAQAIDSFLAANPGAIIFASGRDPARNRLYRMSIQKYLGEIKNRFVLRGCCNKKWRPFKKGLDYDAFTLFRR
ncbi:hypothetical protein SAMN05216327_110153 [Dyadobacter sp. SG02]|uniref:DUF6934 family protein n=1 Tax=Dyadobacter sp. SG02 TaxID=1855291 RepID=UPI0008C53728|nr:hypothetical protein [Dyadobacter sp. SG02]SEJ44206.1 hypothetical protein SAMN05216327_110153 [Dyadobacter sp. SG02]